MSSASAILTSLSDLTNNPKLEQYDPHLCKDIHIKLDKEARDQGLSFQERYEMARKNMSVYKKWESVFPSGISQCLKEYWKERMSAPSLDPRFPNTNQTKRCWVNYVDYHRCMEMKNDEKTCDYFKFHYVDLCPKEWTDKWDDQMAREVFPGIHD
ncbi:unnamed protein product [Rotaria sp. Silwood1]|nr:unnamed protein product [Rotaria sp. Silwood1]CAF1002413.1 unnamed protein product [Rotaria sp. Silwood1]CAF1011307.1 unnamed protein product [Rotaria sp. Silwood1]CAF3396730.1 unnamed protein product [Rotaria sp. Silwood1]CAF3415095.1 unnamed protein product [Rotaria sp. Silwood1]